MIAIRFVIQFLNKDSVHCAHLTCPGETALEETEIGNAKLMQ